MFVKRRVQPRTVGYGLSCVAIDALISLKFTNHVLFSSCRSD
jgi:hypothetical protein